MRSPLHFIASLSSTPWQDLHGEKATSVINYILWLLTLPTSVDVLMLQGWGTHQDGVVDAGAGMALAAALAFARSAHLSHETPANPQQPTAARQFAHVFANRTPLTDTAVS
jgi:hypothetical protein